MAKKSRKSTKARKSREPVRKTRSRASKGLDPRHFIRRKRRSKAKALPSDDRLKTAFRLLSNGQTQKRSAEITGISVKRFSRFLRNNKLAKFKNGRWRITDRRIREVTVITNGERKLIKLRGFVSSSLAMQHFAAVNTFTYSNDIAVLAPFKGQTVTDINKQKYILETRPNVLLRLVNAGSDADMKIYRLID